MSQESGGGLKKKLEKDASVIYALDKDLRITYCNEAWDRFAIENGGRGLERERQSGRSVMEVVPRPLQPFFEKGYRRVLQKRENWEHTYECSSSTIYRTYRMAAYPDPESSGLVVVNSLITERPLTSEHGSAKAASDSVYVDSYGLITVCCHCRRTHRAGSIGAWDWVPAYVENPPPMVSHGICEVCMNLYYSVIY